MGAQPAYELEGRELVAETEGLRVQVLTIGPGQCVPWHRHTSIDDTLFSLEGSVRVELRNPDEHVRLECGERLTVQSERPHRVTAADGGRCRFLIVQGVGPYDYLPEDCGAP